MKEQKIILGSASSIRFKLLRHAGLSFEVVVSGVDEESVRKTFGGDASALAVFLARLKGEAVSKNHDGLVIGADQVLFFEGQIFPKVSNLEEAKKRLQKLRGKTHTLFTGVALSKKGKSFWSYKSASEVSLRNFSDEFLTKYLQEEGEVVCKSVGCYRLEGRGVQLIRAVRGDFFCVLGLPLLPLLEALREEGVTV